MSPSGEPVIELNPTTIGQWPVKKQWFWYGHECGHHALGHGIGGWTPMNETAADCWAIRTMRQQSLLTRQELQQQIVPIVTSFPGSPFGHLPGPWRAAAMVACYDGMPGG
jgi:hypothetical protein